MDTVHPSSLLQSNMGQFCPSAQYVSHFYLRLFSMACTVHISISIVKNLNLGPSKFIMQKGKPKPWKLTEVTQLPPTLVYDACFLTFVLRCYTLTRLFFIQIWTKQHEDRDRCGLSPFNRMLNYALRVSSKVANEILYLYVSLFLWKMLQFCSSTSFCRYKQSSFSPTPGELLTILWSSCAPCMAALILCASMSSFN